MTIYANVTADADRGETIGRLYLSASLYDESPIVREAYDAFIAETVSMAEELMRRIRMSVQDTDPYDSAAAMMTAARTGHLAVLATRTTGGHPYLTDAQNDLFRFVHDYHGHCMTGRGFDRHGEEAAWMRHSAMYSPLARRAMTSETRGQNSAMVWVLGDFPDQRFTLLPEWVSNA